MGYTELSFQSGKDRFAIGYQLAAAELMDCMRKRWPVETNAILGPPTPSMPAPSQHAARDLREHAKRALSKLPGVRHMLPRMYYMWSKRPADYPFPNADPNGRPSFGSGMYGGVRLVGDETHAYLLNVGFDECVLHGYRLNPTVFVESRDLRGRHELHTSNMGVIRFRSHSCAMLVRLYLTGLLAFLDRPDNQVVVREYTRH